MKNKYILVRLNESQAGLYKQDSRGMFDRIGLLPMKEKLERFYKELSEEEATLYLLSLDIKPNA